MIEAVNYEDRNEQSWSAYVDASPAATIAHQIGWRDVMVNGLGHKDRYLLALDGDVVKGILPMVLVTTWWRTRYLVSLPWIDYGGMLADDAETERVLLDKACEYARRDRAQLIEFRSVHAGHMDLPTREHKVTFILDLERDSEKLWKAFDANVSTGGCTAGAVIVFTEAIAGSPGAMITQTVTVSGLGSGSASVLLP